LAAKFGSRTEIQDRCCQGLSASAVRMRRTVDAEIASVMPAAMTSAASSGQLHRDSGTWCSAGSWQASALTSACWAAVIRAGRPERGRSANPSRRRSANRPRQVRTVFTAIPNRVAICALDRPAAASRTILARTTSR
jgi:hypothetical protein